MANDNLVSPVSRKMRTYRLRLRRLLSLLVPIFLLLVVALFLLIDGRISFPVDTFGTFNQANVSKENAQEFPLFKVKSLWDWGSNLRLVTGSPSMSPFVQGTYIDKETVARVTVFDAEILHGMKAGASEWDLGAEPMVNVMAFIETHQSINHTQWEHWALAIQSDLSKNIQLKCVFSHSSHGSSQVFHESDAKLLLNAPWNRFTNIHCPLPKSASKYIVEITSRSFELTLKLRNETDKVLHLETLPLVRDDGSKSPRLHNLSWKSSVSPIPTVNYGDRSQGKPFDREVTVAPKTSDTTVALCVRPYHDHHFFSPKGVTKSNTRLLEFIDYHLLIGVTKIYFYDRYGTDYKAPLMPYIERGIIEHIPFPVWSEVYYRKEAFNKALYPYNFPLIYDQIISYEHCMMQGRRNDDTWLFFTDTDEFLQYPEPIVGGLPNLMDKITAKYESEKAGVTLSSVGIRRFNYGGANESGDPVLELCTSRCRGPIYNLVYNGDGSPNFIKHKDKLGARPGQMVGSTIEVHEVEGPARERLTYVSEDVLRINHYSSAPFSEYKGEKGTAVGSPCNKVEDPWQLEYTWIEDSSLQWASSRLHKCTKPYSCLHYTKGECGGLCPNS